MSDATQLIDALGNGDPQAASALLPLMYAELRRLARALRGRRGTGRRVPETESNRVAQLQNLQVAVQFPTRYLDLVRVPLSPTRSRKGLVGVIP